MVQIGDNSRIPALRGGDRTDTQDTGEIGEDDNALFTTAREFSLGMSRMEGDLITQLVRKIDDLASEVATLKMDKNSQKQKILRFLNTTESESGSEKGLEDEKESSPIRSRKSARWEKDLPRLTKVIKTKELNPKTEEEFEDIAEEWEIRSKGCGMDPEVLKHLVLHLGAPSVILAAKSLDLNRLSWQNYKDEIAKELFPFSNYVRNLEADMEKVDRKQPLSSAVVELNKNSERHQVLCRRWGRQNTFGHDRLKEALLRKIPQTKIAACLGIPNFGEMTFPQFVRHCQMVLAAAEAEEREIPKDQKKEADINQVMPVAVAAEALSTRSQSSRLGGGQAVVPEQRCPNCGEAGHYMRNCPKPRVKCEVCGRSGHRKEICFKAQQEAPNGKLRTSYLRMTRSGIHLDLIDEATKKSLFEAMRRHLEHQEQQCAKAKDRAKQKREERKEAKEAGGADHAGEWDEEEEGQVSAAVEFSPRISAAKINQELSGDLTVQNYTKYVDVEIFEKTVPALLDSGAVVSLLPKRIWERVPKEKKDWVTRVEGGSKPISGLGGELVVEVIIDTPIIVAGKEILQRFFVTPNAGSMILGMDALQGLGVQMNFKTGEIHFFEGHKSIPESAVLGVSPLCVSIVETPVGIANIKTGKGCTEQEKIIAQRIFNGKEEIWKTPEVGGCRLTSHKIDTGSASPIAARARRLPPEKLEELRRQLRDLESSGAISRSKSPWASPIVLVPKSNGKVRLCVDYRRLNATTKRDMYPMPRITELLDRMSAARVFTTMDLTAGFHQIPLDQDSQEKTAFITPEGLFEFRVLPFGLTNAPSTFQRAMDTLLRDSPLAENVGVYMDDIVVFSATAEQHAATLEQVCQKLKEAKLYVNLEKTIVFAREVKYLGFVVGNGEVHPDKEQVKALQLLSTPKDVSGVRRFLGLTGYFRRFIPRFSEKTLPLTALLKKENKFEWTNECQQAWEALKEELAGPGVRLMLPLPHRIFTLDTDASDYAIGVVLLQEDEEGRLRPLSYASRTLTSAEKNWATREKEAFAIVWGILHFAAYLRWQPHFLVRSDHESLQWLWRSENKRIIRWALTLQEYNFSVKYNKGMAHQHVDIFSRDVANEEGDGDLLDRISLKPGVFAVAEKEVEGMAKFPTYEEIQREQRKECTPDRVSELKLRLGTQSIYQTEGGKVFVPVSLRRAIMYYFHFGKMGMHQGINKVFARIRRVFWWPGLRDDIQDYSNHCLTCARRRPQPIIRGRGHLLASRVGAVVAIDIVGPMEVTGGATNLLTIIDHFTKYAQAVPLENMASATIWKALLTRWIAYLGTPNYLLSDNAAVFRSKEFEARAEEYGIKRIFSFPYHPQGNGVVEAFHHYLKRSLSAALKLGEGNLEVALTDVLMAYRATPHIATGETPYFLLTGMDMTLPNMQDWVEIPTGKSQEERMVMLRQLREQAFDQLARSAVSKEKSLTQRKKEKPLEPGALVLSWLDPGERAQLQRAPGGYKSTPLWSGPCRVIRKLEGRENTYVVRRLWEGGRARTQRRETLMELPGKWNQEEAELALKELLSDLKRPRGSRDLPEQGGSEDEPTERDNPANLEKRGQEFVRDLTRVAEEDPKESTSDAPEDSRTQASEGVQEGTWARPPKKAKRSIRCVGWKEVDQWLHEGGQLEVQIEES